MRKRIAAICSRPFVTDGHTEKPPRSAQHGRSIEAEVPEVLLTVVTSDNRVLVGDALAAIGREIGLTNEDFVALESLVDERLTNHAR
jgi:plasmid stability protein